MWKRELPWLYNRQLFALSEERQLAYLPYAPKFIQHEYRRRCGTRHSRIAERLRG
jgi:hypothetical protein